MQYSARSSFIKKSLILMACIMGVIAAIQIQNAVTFKIGEISPEPNSFPKIIRILKVKFNKNIDAKQALENGVIKLEGIGVIYHPKVSGNILTINLDAETSSSAFKLVITGLKDASGRTLNKTVDFKVVDRTYNRLGSNEKKLFVEQADLIDHVHSGDDPALIQERLAAQTSFTKRFLPIRNPYYIVNEDANSSEAKPIIRITMRFLNPSTSSYEAPKIIQDEYLEKLARYRQAAYNQLVRLGYKPETAQIIYTEPELQDNLPSGYRDL